MFRHFQTHCVLSYFLFLYLFFKETCQFVHFPFSSSFSFNVISIVLCLSFVFFFLYSASFLSILLFLHHSSSSVADLQWWPVACKLLLAAACFSSIDKFLIPDNLQTYVVDADPCQITFLTRFILLVAQTRTRPAHGCALTCFYIPRTRTHASQEFVVAPVGALQ